MNTPNKFHADRSGWEIPAFETLLWEGRRHPWCVVIPVINEGERIRNLLARMTELKISKLADIIIVDGAAGESGNYQLVMDLSVMPSCFVGIGCVECPIGSNYESELCPATYPDPNAGPACAGSGYETINCGETMCGKATHTNTWLDKDAYYVTLHQRDSIRFCVMAEFPVTLTLYEFFPG